MRFVVEKDPLIRQTGTVGRAWRMPLARRFDSCDYFQTFFSLMYELTYSRPQRPRSFWSAPGIETSGRSQFRSMHRVLVLCFSANQICHIWQWVRESRTSCVRGGQRSRFLAQTRLIAASGDENGVDFVAMVMFKAVKSKYGIRYNTYKYLVYRTECIE